MRFTLVSQAGSVELLFMFGDQCLYVNKSVNSICSSYKAIVSSEILTRFIWISFQSFNELCIDKVVVAWTVNGGQKALQNIFIFISKMIESLMGLKQMRVSNFWLN